MKKIWMNDRIHRLSCWLGIIHSPSLHFIGIKKPTFRQAWTGVLYDEEKSERQKHEKDKYFRV